MKMVTKMMVAMIAVLGATCSLLAADPQNATEDVAAFEAGLQAIASKPKLMAAKLLSAASGTTVYPASGSDMNVTGRKGVPLDLYFNVSMASVSSATLYLNAYDVDYPSATERDDVYFNDTYIGRLQGYDNGENMNTFDIPARLIKIGSNHVHIDVDVATSGSWVTQMREGTKLVLNGEEGRVTLTVSKDLLNKIELNWSANYSGAAPYNIYRGKTSDNLTIYREGLTVTSFADTDIVPGDTYYYQIKTMSGVSSTIEEAKSVKSVITVTASQDLYHKVKLSWTTENCTGPFTIYRGETEEGVRNPQQRTTVVEEWNAYTYVDDKVNGGQDYYYLVVASNETVNDPVAKGMNRRAEITLTPSTDSSDYVKLEWTCPLPNLKYRIGKSRFKDGLFPKFFPAVDSDTPFFRFLGNSYYDSECEKGDGFYYFVESDLGVRSNIRYGCRVAEERDICIVASLEGSDYPMSYTHIVGDSVIHGAIGSANESNVLVAGHKFSCRLDISDVDSTYTIQAVKLTGFPIGDVAKNKHEIVCVVESSWKDQIKYLGWRKANLTFVNNSTISFDAALEVGRGYHGKYNWRAECVCLQNGERRTKLIDIGEKNVYFDKESSDGWLSDKPNWFVYWGKDGACPGLLRDKLNFKCVGDPGLGGYCDKYGNVTLTEMAARRIGSVTANGINFFKWDDGHYVYGIYRVEDTVAHEFQHADTHRRYEERVVEDINGNIINDKDRGVETKECVVNPGAFACCEKEIKNISRYVCDSIVDEDERNDYWGKYSLRYDNADTHGLMKTKHWSYGAYGDDEFVSMMAGRASMHKAVPTRDWAYPGEIAGGIPYLATKSQGRKMAKALKAEAYKTDALVDAGGGNIFVDVTGLSKEELFQGNCLTGLLYRLGVKVVTDEQIGLCGHLVNAQGNEICSVIAGVGAGENTVSFMFDGKDISKRGLEGPYTLGSIDLSVEDSYSNIVFAALSDFVLTPVQVDLKDVACVSGAIIESFDVVCVEGGLKASIPTKCNIAGEYELVGELSDTNGNYVARARVSQAMAVGTNEVALTFAGAEIYNSAHDGPYVLSSVQLWSDDEMIDAATDLLTTEVAYSYEDFKPADTVVTVDRESAAFAAPAVLSDGALGALTFSFDVNNATEDSLCYRLSAALDGATGETVAMQNGKYVYLEPGVNHIEVTFSASAIAEKGIDGPYMMGLIELVHQDDLGNALSFRPTVATEAYKASDFAAAAVAFSNEPSAKGVLECDTPTVVLPFEAKRACTVVASATLIGTNGEFIARASVTNRCDAAGAQTAEIVFPREALVAAGQQGPFSVGYFALLPLVDGEEPIYSDTFEVTGVEWIDWEGMFDWTFEGGTAQAALYKGTNGVVRVPSFVKGRDVISVGPCCFLDCECVTEIVLPVGIADVGIGAFFGTSLSAVEIPESVATVGNAAFNVEGLELVVFDGPPPMSAPDAYPKGAVGTYSAAYAAAWEAELKGGCLWNGLTMVPEGADVDGYRTESGWTVVGPDDATACEGKRTFRSAETADGASSAMTMSVDEETSVSFWWKTSCEGSGMDDWQGDHAEFLIDGVVMERMAGESCWKQVVVNISDPGQHELSWRYVKDGAGASGSDCVWVSDVGFATVAGEMTHAELLPEADYNWFYENSPVEFDGDTPFEHIPEKPLPERTLAQIDILCDFWDIRVVDIDKDKGDDSAQMVFGSCANGEGFDFVVWTADGWMRVGNALVGEQQGVGKVTFCFDYSAAPSRFSCKVNNHTLTNENGQSSFVCAKQDCRANGIVIDSDVPGHIEAWAGLCDAGNSEIVEVTEETEKEYDADLSNLPRETFQVSGGGTLVIKGADVPAAGVKARLHVDQNSALRFDYSTFTSLPSVLKLFSGVGNDFTFGGNVSIVVPGEGSDRLSKLCVKNGNLEAHIAERPEIVAEGGSGSSFAIDGEVGSASLDIGNAVEGFWYGLLTTSSLTSDFLLDRDSVKQCTSSGVLKLESSANSDSDAGFYRVSVSTEEP